MDSIRVRDFITNEVPNWDNEIVAVARFKAFSGQRSDWEPRFVFWRDLIIKVATHFQFLLIQPSQVKNEWFNRGGLTPLCLDHVLSLMYNEGDITRTVDLADPTSGRLSQLFRKVSNLITRPSAPDITSEECVIVTTLLKDKAAEVVKHLSESHWTSSCIVTMKKFQGICGGPEEASAILRYLSGCGTAQYLSAHKKEFVEGVKISLSGASLSSISNLDFDVLHLIWTTEKLQQQLDVIDRRYELSRKSAMDSLHSGNRKLALRYARELKLFNQSREKCSSLLNRVEEVLGVIADAESTKKVSEAMQIGARAIKENKISVEDVDLCLRDLQESIDSQKEVERVLGMFFLSFFHPFPALDSSIASASDDGEAENNPLLQKLYRFETVQLCPPVAKKPSLMTPAMTSGLFPESTIAEESVKQEGPAVEMLEYHCNSCAGDCSRKRYHCQKQADFDLCTDCFSNSRFGAGMSPLDFILMEPAEAAGVSGGKWTDQETLLLLEALELYKENWNEIAEHVGTKSKAQCILHFVQMPIEDVFIDSDDADADGSCKETADLSATNKDPSLQKDSSENAESNANDSIEGLDKTSKAEDDKVKIKQGTPKLEDGSDEKTSEETSKSEDTIKVKHVQEVGNDCALNALKEAFADVGYSPGPECPSSFAEVGNPVMALASFLAHLVSSDVAVASAHSFLKSMSGNSPGTELAARHCFLLEDPPYNKKEPASSERDSKNEGELEIENVKQDKPTSDDKDLPNDDTNMKIDNNVLEDNRQLASTDDGDSEKPISSKEQAMVNHETLELDKCKDLSHSKLPNNQAPSTLHGSGGSTSKNEIPPTKELHEGTLVKEPGNPVEELRDGHVSDSLVSEKHLQPVEIPKDAEMASDSKPSDKSIPQKLLSTNPVHKSLETTDSEMDVDMVYRSLPSEKSDSQPLSTAVSSQHNGIEKEIDMMPPSHPVRPNSETVAGEDHAENGTKVKEDSTKTKRYNNFEKLKHAAVSTLAAAAVKAKVLANQEDDQIRQLTSLLIERQLHKLEAKLGFFNDVENVVMRARDHLERSRQKLYHERALIIASRLGIPPSSSRGVPPSLPTNRIPVNFANSIPRSQNMINPQMLPTSRPAGTVATTIPSLPSATSAGSSVRPSSKEKLSFVGTK